MLSTYLNNRLVQQHNIDRCHFWWESFIFDHSYMWMQESSASVRARELKSLISHDRYLLRSSSQSNSQIFIKIVGFDFTNFHYNWFEKNWKSDWMTSEKWRVCLRHLWTDPLNEKHILASIAHVYQIFKRIHNLKIRKYKLAPVKFHDLFLSITWMTYKKIQLFTARLLQLEIVLN